jgi:hypothetical protein
VKNIIPASSLAIALLVAGCVGPRQPAAEKHKAPAAPTPPPQPAPMPPPLAFQGDPSPPSQATESASSPLSAEALVADEANIPKYALNLKVGMTVEQAGAVFRPHPLKLESTASGANGSVAIYRTLVISDQPEIWLTFFSGSLQSWAAVTKR